MTKKIRIGITALGIIILCILLKLFVIGEPVDGAQLAYNITQNDATLELQVSATESAVALKGWKIEQEGNNVFISTKKVPVSFLFSSDQYQTSINIDGIENVYLGGQIIYGAVSKFQFTQQDPRLMFRAGTQGGGLVIVLLQISAQSSG